MRVLAIDTSADYAALLLLENNAVRDTRYVETARDQAKILAPLCADLLAANNLLPQALDRLAIVTGPGSFTGLRVGLAFARGLALALQKPLYGFDHFILAAEALKAAPQPLLVLRDSRRAELFACWVESGKAGRPFLATVDAALNLALQNPDARISGNAAPLLLERNTALAEHLQPLPPLVLLETAARLADKAPSEPQTPATPLYLRDADVSLPKQHPHA